MIKLDKMLWTSLFFYGNVGILVIVFFLLVDKKRLKELIPVGLFIAVENYTLEIIGLYLGYWSYPFDNPGYPEVTVISTLIYFPFIAILYYQYLSADFTKNILLTTGFVVFNMVTEILTLKTTNLFVYHKGMNLLVAFLIYLMAYILIILFGRFYKKLD